MEEEGDGDAYIFHRALKAFYASVDEKCSKEQRGMSNR